MALTLRSTKGIALTWAEMDDNFSGLADGSLWGNAVSAPGSLTLASALTISGGGLTFGSGQNAQILIGTADGSDNRGLFLCAGGDASSSRGAALLLYGNEHATGGRALLGTGNSGTANDQLLSQVRGVTGLTIDPSLAVTLADTLSVGSIGAFVASDKYLVVDASGNVHKSATGPAS